MDNRKTKFIFVTGGVVSSLGKGLATASIGLMLKSMGYSICFIKCDPYLNIDPGTMNPNQHGEVFVTADGAETDLDLGHYERFTNCSMQRSNSITSGKIYSAVLEKERRGDYLGQTVQVVPHVIDEIKHQLFMNARMHIDVILCEIGGTVGDIEAMPFLEAIRQMYLDSPEDILCIHMTLVPYLRAAEELKTKPTQHSVRELRALGIQPSALLCRTEMPLSEELRKKIANFCSMKSDSVIAAVDQRNIYEIPLSFHEYGLDKVICNYFKFPQPKNGYLSTWESLVSNMNNATNKIRVAIIAKYAELTDSYKSLLEALKHAGAYNSCVVEYLILDSKELNSVNIGQSLKNFNGVIVPGGFGSSGIDGKISAIKFARENNVPFLGICMGMQLAAIEIARNVGRITDANSEELEQNCKNPIILRMSEWIKDCQMRETRTEECDLGGTMRLGSYKCKIEIGSLAYKIYNSEFINERHRHRYEVNNKYKTQLEACGIKFSGIATHQELMEILELSGHKWFLCTQFHPELQSSLLKPHPIFCSFIKACT